MKEGEIITQLVTEIDAVTPGDVDVRTDGGDYTATPPEVIITWNPVRLNRENGHNSIGGFVTDGSGNKVGIEHHVYFRMDITLTVRSYDESERDELLDTVGMAFLPYETDASQFDKDTAEWMLDTGSPRPNTLLEPDWYETGIRLSFKYVKRMQDTDHDTVETIDTEVEADDTIIDISTELK